MLIDWTHWLSSLRPSELLWFLAPLFFFDVIRYSLGSVLLCWSDIIRRLWSPRRMRHFGYQPSVSVILAGLNEADTIDATLHSVWGTYPNMQIIVVDDGSQDGMTEVARNFAETHAGVLVLRKPHRGGKSSALNFALPFIRSEIVIAVDTDSQLVENAIWEIVQPFRDPLVGAVGGTVIARNPFTNLATRLQALEYLRCIFIGRMLSERLGVLGIVSGAFGAFRREAMEKTNGWDVGPGEDGDLVLRLRKGGYRIRFAPYAQCLTNLPRSFKVLFKQRRRWEWAVITFECRKHIDMGNLFAASFRWSNLALLVERWTFNVVAVYAFWLYIAWMCYAEPQQFAAILFLNYLVYVVLEVIQLLVILYFSADPRRDLNVGLVLPLMPFYAMWLRLASLVAVSEELFTRRSFRDSFVPAHVRRVTWHW